MSLGVVATLMVLGASPIVVAAQEGRPLTVAELSEIYGSGGDVGGWDEFDIPEFVAAAYGARARSAVLQILEEPSSNGFSYFQLEAVTTAQYGRVGVPVAALLSFAARVRDATGVIRQRTLIALSMKPDTGLKDLWLEVAREKQPSFRQVAAGGLACALGNGATEHLERMTRDSSDAVARVATFHLRELRTKGDLALSCGGKVTRRGAPSYPNQLRPHLRERGAAWLVRIP